MGNISKDQAIVAPSAFLSGKAMAGSAERMDVPDWDDFMRQAQQPSLLIIAQRGWQIAGSGCVDDIAGMLGLRLLDYVPADRATKRLAHIVDVDGIMLRCTGREPGLDLLLARLDTIAANQGTELIVVTDMDGLDHVHAIIGAGSATLLCQPGLDDIIVSLAGIVARRESEARLHDVGRAEAGDPLLNRLSDEVGRLSRTIEALVHNRAPSHFAAPEQADGGMTLYSPARAYSSCPPVEEPAPVLTARQVRALLRMRRLREDIMPSDLFADPAWDILLDLMAARLENKQVSVSSLCIAAAVPPTTGLRWIRQLTERGLLERKADPDDGRRIFIALSDKGVAAVNRWFQESQSHMRLALGQAATMGPSAGRGATM